MACACKISTTFFLSLAIAVILIFRRPIFNSLFGPNFIPENNWKEPVATQINFDAAPVFDINLDLPLDQRYKEVLFYYKNKGFPIIEHVMHNITAGLGVPRFLIEPLLDSFEILYPLYHDEEVKEFIELIVQNTPLSRGFAFMLNFLYELVHFIPLWPLPDVTYCTSVVLTNEKGETLLGRNWDFAFPESLSKMIFVTNNYRGGKLHYVAMEIFGYHGVIQGYKPNSFSIAANARLDSSLFGNLWNIFVDKRISGPKLTRIALDKANTFDEAKKILKSTKIITGIYYIMAGALPYQGFVMARSADKVVLLDELEENKTWYLCQTNWDRNKEDPLKDLRRTGCEKNMKKLGKEANATSIMNLLLHPPSFNVIWGWTISSQVFIPKISYFNHTVVDWNQKNKSEKRVIRAL